MKAKLKIEKDLSKPFPGQWISVAVFRSDGLGDWFLTFPLLSRIQEVAPVGALTLLGPLAEEIVGEFSRCNAIKVGMRGPAPVNSASSFLRNILLRLGLNDFICLLFGIARGRRFDVLILPRASQVWGFGDLGIAIGMRLANANIRISKPQASKEDQPVHEAVLAMSVQVPSVGFSEVRVSHRRVKPRTPLAILFHSGAASKSRRWPVAYWIELVSHVRARTTINCEIYVDNDILQSMRLACSSDVQGVQLLDNQSVLHLSRAISVATLLVCSDSAPAHIASWLGVPSLVLSPHPVNGNRRHMQSPDRFGPWSVGSRVLQPLRGVGRCTSHCAARRSHCITQIKPSRVSMVIDEMLTISDDDRVSYFKN